MNTKQGKSTHINTNTFLNTIKSVSGIIFPLITFPYITNVLLVNNVGRINFGLSVVSYFSLLASLGISTYAVRECAKVKDNRKVLGINPVVINPKYINNGYGRKILQHLINCKGKIFEMLPDRIYAGIDVSNERCRHLFMSLGFKQVGQTDDNDFLYYELEL